MGSIMRATASGALLRVAMLTPLLLSGACAEPESVVSAVSVGRGECGDGALDPGESCDDGNIEDGDACPASCARPVAMIEAGAYFACALLADNRLKCWGYNAYGGIGAGDVNNRGDAAGEMGADLPFVAP